MKYYVTYNNSNPVSGFDSLFNDLWADWGTNRSKIPPVDIYETEKAYVIEAELAGYKQEEVSVNIEKHVLKISSDKQSLKSADEKQKNLVRERYFKKFERSFSLPEDIDEGNIEGEFADGVLTITLPKKKEALPKTIEVKIK
ncbi:MAG: Hsp20/alpha crystallin family protein [Sphaerochaeta sp.]|uniref:Hsp20/alpha crystallin family protein n=1 Tax=Sphaerochaeta sp. S2 TaxID=2798868 RepID=UPI0018E9F687|nr:Hsp20/alpha crystallin family protein [Sphaerochaeta sp. S2]MCK9348169.1 Hsp20/alpha crystallin family protein [Sphaerochaeta sp.]MBJ2356643.1 Hsp20/alpha crystallin family protein [Sphaerochaeta sp. S2]MDD4301279.1 Hsp20/alpha crystallin family protein [Sphaerochaeta sp.]MDD4646990.1 Hsp20/alpha crystallin family protein [Sphaerochaeta sp.]MDY0244161.1 Hsp20/alpha crystallin family protein [Sphaerochaeta sp.]